MGAVTETRGTQKNKQVDEGVPPGQLTDQEKKDITKTADKVPGTDVQGVAHNITGQGTDDGFQPTGVIGAPGVGANKGEHDAPKHRGTTVKEVAPNKQGTTTYEQFRQPNGQPWPKPRGKGTYPTGATLQGPEANGAKALNDRGINVHALMDDSAKGYPGTRTADASVRGKMVDFTAPQYVNGELDPATGRPSRTLEEQMTSKAGQAQEVYFSDEKMQKSTFSQKEFAKRFDEGVRSGTIPKTLDGAYVQTGDTVKHYKAPVAPEAAAKVGKAARVLGPVGLAVGAVTDAVRFTQSDDKVKTGASIAGGWAVAALGAKAGGSIGATIGTFIAPGIGTVVGGVVGGAIGAGVGYFVGSKVGEKAVDFVREPVKELKSAAKTVKRLAGKLFGKG